MSIQSYETHIISNPQLPFLYHPPQTDHTKCKRCGPNWHENIEILYCTRGSAYFMLDGQQYAFVPGDFCIANAYCVHTTRQEDNLDYRCLIVDRAFCEANGIRTNEIHFEEWFRDEIAAEAFGQVVAAYENYSPADPLCIADIRYAVLGFLRVLCRRHIVRNDAASATASRERVKKVIVYLTAHYSDSISLQNVAEHVGISKYYLTREFREYTGSTVFDTLNLIRCAQAKRMIEDGANVSEAAHACGYENMSYFTRAFKKQLGILPSDCLAKEHRALPKAAECDV